MDQDVSVTKYVIRFALVNMGLLIGMAIMLGLLGIESSSGTTLAALLGAAMATTYKFIQDHRRIPSSGEKTKLVWLSYLASWVVSLVLVGIFVGISEEGLRIVEVLISINVLLLVGIIAFLSIFYVGALYVAYGYLAVKQYEGMQKKGKI
jgi:choline-glycine betaine transporter